MIVLINILMYTVSIEYKSNILLIETKHLNTSNENQSGLTDIYMILYYASSVVL